MNRRGFTLLELVIAITVFSLVVMVIAGSLRLGYRAVQSGRAHIESLERRKSSLMIIQSQIRSFVPIAYYDTEQGSNAYRFHGSGDVVSFPTNYSVWGGAAGGLVYVTYRVVDDGGGGKNVYVSEENLFAPGFGEDEYGGGEVLLVEGAHEVGFEYFDKGPLKPEGEWVEYWEDPKRLPEMIKVNIHGGGGAPPLSIPLKLRARG